jgi:hypothetical protein
VLTTVDDITARCIFVERISQDRSVVVEGIDVA